MPKKRSIISLVSVARSPWGKGNAGGVAKGENQKIRPAGYFQTKAGEMKTKRGLAASLSETQKKTLPNVLERGQSVRLNNKRMGGCLEELLNLFARSRQGR